MGKLDRQMMELRHLRDSAKALLREDVAFLKGDSGGRPVAPRLMETASDKVRDVAGRSAQLAGDHKLKIGTGIAIAAGAFVAWIFRARIEQAFDQLLDYFNDDDHDDGTDLDDEALESSESNTAPTE